MDFQQMVERLYLRDVQRELQCKTLWSVRRWCRNNDVGILSDAGSRKQYVLAKEFEMAKAKEPLRYFVQKYGKDKLPEVLKAHMDLYSEYRAVLDDLHDAPVKNYTPHGENELRFLNSLKA